MRKTDSDQLKFELRQNIMHSATIFSWETGEVFTSKDASQNYGVCLFFVSITFVLTN